MTVGTPPPADKASPQPFKTRRLQVAEGIELELDEIAGSGGGPPAILLHGAGQTRHSWSTAGSRLEAAGYRVVLYDARGHGGSDWSPDGDYSISSLADDLGEVIRHCGRPVGLVGASMGGMTAFMAAGRLPQQVTALVLVDVVPSPDPAGAERIRAFMASRPDGYTDLEDAADAVAAYNPHRRRPSDASGLMRNLRRGRDGRLHWHWDPAIVTSPPLAEPQSFLAEALKVSDKIVAPTLLIRGAVSDVVTDEGVRQLSRMVSQAEVLEVAGAGHMVSGDRNDAFTQGALDFLRRHHPTDVR